MPANSGYLKFAEGAGGYFTGMLLSQKIQGYFNDLFEVSSGGYLSIECWNTRKFKILWLFEGIEIYKYEWRIYGGGHELWMQYMYSGWGYQMTPWYKVAEMTHSEFKNVFGE